MKKYLPILFILIFLANSNSLLSQYWYEYNETTVSTPTGVTIEAWLFNEDDYDDFDAPTIAAQNYAWTYGYNCRILANSTKYYNCHGFAWYNIEGQMSQSDLRWINELDNEEDPNIAKYYTGDNRSYTETQTYSNHLRVSYVGDDHSAVTTEDEDSLVSKWATC